MKTLRRIIETEVIDEPIPEEPEDVPPSDKLTSNTSMNFSGPFLSEFIDVDYPARRAYTSYRAGDMVLIDEQIHKCLMDGVSGAVAMRHLNANVLIDGSITWMPLNLFSRQAMQEMMNVVFRP